jgi:purine-binding chemotaxis protein CheW
MRTREVLHIEMLDQITPVPNAPPFVDGVVFSRGQVIPAVNLRVRFGFAREPHTLRTRLLVVQAEKRAAGLIVDSAREFRTIPGEVIQPPDAAISGLSGKFLSGIATFDDRLILLLDLAAVMELIQTEVPTSADTAPAIS